jgi:hypothetical protein
MKPKLFLRIASIAMFFHLLGHTMGQLSSRTTDDPVKREVLDQMTQHKFLFMGTWRSMIDYSDGFSYATSIALLLIAIILWLVSNESDKKSTLGYRILLTLTICLFVWSIDEFIFFFPFAACITLVAAITTMVATIQWRNANT